MLPRLGAYAPRLGAYATISSIIYRWVANAENDESRGKNISKCMKTLVTLCIGLVKPPYLLFIGVNFHSAFTPQNRYFHYVTNWEQCVASTIQNLKKKFCFHLSLTLKKSCLNCFHASNM